MLIPLRTMLLVGATCALTAAAPPISADRLLPAKDVSAIYSPLALPGTPDADAIARAGYVQEEYLLSGVGNIYEAGADGRGKVRQSGLHYTTRAVIVRPRDPRRYSGVVQLGFSHPQFGSNQWSRVGPDVLRHGDMYVLLQIGGDPGTRQRSKPGAPVATPLVLPWFDAVRYKSFNWPDDGVRWDAMGQTIVKLRTGALPAALRPFKARQLYVSGWSYLGSLQRSYINWGFHDRYRMPDGKPAVDGYLIGISSNSVDAGFVPINSDNALPPVDQRQLRVIDVPVIELMSENEARTNSLPQRPDVDSYAGGHRLYELGGVSHQDSGLPATTGPWERQLVARGNSAWAPGSTCTTPATDVPMRDLAEAAVSNLKLWHDKGIAPPSAQRMEIAAPGKVAVDSFGNARGGVRPVQLALPLARYGDARDCTGLVRFQVLRRIAFDKAQVAAAYPAGKAEYLNKVRLYLDGMVADRWLLKADADAQYARIVAYADDAFLP